MASAAPVGRAAAFAAGEQVSAPAEQEPVSFGASPRGFGVIAGSSFNHLIRPQKHVRPGEGRDSAPTLAAPGRTVKNGLTTIDAEHRVRPVSRSGPRGEVVMPLDRVAGQLFEPLVDHPGRRGRVCSRGPPMLGAMAGSTRFCSGR